MQFACRNGGGSDVAIERVEECGALEGYGQGNVCLNVTWREVGYEVMIARVVAAPDGLQSEARLHGFRLGSTCKRLCVDVVEDGCALSLQGCNVVFHRLGHAARTGDDESTIARAGSGHERAVLVADAHEQSLGDVVAVESGTVNVEYRLDELRRQLAHGVD